MKAYRTVNGEGTFILEEKRSRFLARVKPISSEAEAMAYLSSIRSEHWDASHHCYAYYIESDAIYQRFSDDGEPAGTAGMPILDVIRKRQLVNVIIVVTRYFGGILLGAGGLVRAYGKAAAKGVEEAREIWVKTCIQAEIHIEYHLSGKLNNQLAGGGYIIADTAYTEVVCVKVLLDEDRKDAFEKMMNDLTGGKSDIRYTGKVPVRLSAEGALLEVGSIIETIH